MDISGSEDGSDPPGLSAGRSVYRETVDVVLTGLAVIVPLVVTVYVLRVAFSFVVNTLDPFVGLLEWAGVLDGVDAGGPVSILVDAGLYASTTEFVTDVVAFVVLATTVVGVGALAHNRYGERLIDYFDGIVTAIPGVGSVYRSFRRMSDVMVGSDVDSFREVRLVEFPHDDVYVIGFETNESPDPVADAAGEDALVTLFLPLAPNPVMGGFLAHVPRERVHDVDMTVEQGVQEIITSGVATPDDDVDGGATTPSTASVGDLADRIGK